MPLGQYGVLPVLATVGVRRTQEWLENEAKRLLDGMHQIAVGMQEAKRVGNQKAYDGLRAQYLTIQGERARILRELGVRETPALAKVLPDTEGIKDFFERAGAAVKGIPLYLLAALAIFAFLQGRGMRRGL